MNIGVFFEMGRNYPIGLKFPDREQMISIKAARQLYNDLGHILQQADSKPDGTNSLTCRGTEIIYAR